MKLNLYAEVDGELQEAARWYDQQQPGLGAEFVELVDEAFARVEANPASYPRLETIRTRRDIRRCLLQRFPITWCTKGSPIGR